MVITESFRSAEVLGLKFGLNRIGKPKMYTHIYFVDGLLIDTGQSRMRKWILSETKALPVEQIFLTHHHEDHTGNVRQLKEQHNCKVYAYDLCCQMMKDPS